MRARFDARLRERAERDQQGRNDEQSSLFHADDFRTARGPRSLFARSSRRRVSAHKRRERSKKISAARARFHKKTERAM
jgi:hypothetical protein